jgi:hypothetical protein
MQLLRRPYRCVLFHLQCVAPSQLAHDWPTCSATLIQTLQHHTAAGSSFICVPPRSKSQLHAASASMMTKTTADCTSTCAAPSCCTNLQAVQQHAHQLMAVMLLLATEYRRMAAHCRQQGLRVVSRAVLVPRRAACSAEQSMACCTPVWNSVSAVLQAELVTSGTAVPVFGGSPAGVARCCRCFPASTGSTCTQAVLQARMTQSCCC